jgi:hypothetical protein
VSRIEPALAEELRRARSQGRAGAALPVVVEHVSAVDAPSGTDRGGALAAMDRRAAELQRGIVARLEELGVRSDMRRAALANALFVTLQPHQIEEIASHPDVRLVRWDRPADVTL